MRLATIALILASSSTAFAADHLARIGEVMISNQGSTASQFIEIEDPAGESFPSPPYSLGVFDAAGGALGTVSLTINAGTTRYLIATTTAATQFSVTANATLSVTLPANGQACFIRMSARLHCFAWGNVTSAIIGGVNNTGASPPDGMSVQRISGQYTVGTPSPGAANTAALPDSSIIPDASVPDGPAPDGASGIDAPGGNPNNPSGDDGCSVGASASWFALVGLVGLVALRRRRT